MRKDVDLPNDVYKILNGERIEISFKSKRKNPFVKSIFKLLFALAWLISSILFAYIFIKPLFNNGDIEFEFNGEVFTGNLDNIDPVLPMILFLSFFVAMGIYLLLRALFLLFQKGGYFVATPVRLIYYYKGKVKFYNWSEFNGNMKINSNNGDIVLELKTGKIVYTENSPSRYEPEIIYISGIVNVFNVEKILRGLINKAN